MSKLAMVTGASSGIGLELAKCCAAEGFDLLIASDEPEIETAAAELRSMGVQVDAIQCNLNEEAGVDAFLALGTDREVDFLLANAGQGLGHGFVDQEWTGIRRVIDTNVTGTLYLVYRIATEMAKRGEGKILFTGSIAGFMPGTFNAVYNASKAFIDSFAIALRHELQETGVSVTVLMPGATDTGFFERADMLDTKVGQAEKDDPADVARTGFQAMIDGDAQVVSGWKNKLQAAAAHVTPAGILAERHRKMAEPGTGAD